LLSQHTEIPQPTLIPEPFISSTRTKLAFIIISAGIIFFAGSAMSFYAFTSLIHQNASNKSQTAAIEAIQSDAFGSVVLQAQSAYVYDIATHQVLFTLNPDGERPLASLTKIAMALAVSEVLDQNSTMVLPYNVLSPGNAQYLSKGSTWPIHDVLDFTLVASSNQGADALSGAANDLLHAKYPASPEIGATVWRMNDIAQSLGLTSMYFLNDNGLDISTTHAGAYGSARDVGNLLVYAASTSPALFRATTQDSKTFKNAAGEQATAINTDNALDVIPGIIMGKTGYTDLAGGNLGIVYDAGIGHPVVAVVLGSTEDGRFQDMQALISATSRAIAEGL